MTVPTGPDGLREQVADAIYAEWSQLPDDRTPQERLATAALAVVQPLLDAKQAENDRLRAAARSAAVLLRATADRPGSRTVLLAAARDLDDITKESR